AGTNTVTVVVTAQDGTTKTYTITVTRAKSSNADLSALTLSAGALDPVFASGTESYTVSVGNAVTSIDVTPTVADSTATVTVNNDTINSGSPKNVTLNAGTNTVTVVVTAQDGTTKTYTITVTRAKSSNADLSALTLSDGTLDPVFAAGTESYTASVGNAITSIDVTPTVADSTATVKVNNDTITSGNAKNVTLNVGANTVTVVVMAQDGTTTKTYTITVTRAKSSNADLGALALSAGTLDPVFAAGTESYTASVGNAVTSIDVTPTVADSTAKVTVNNDPVASGSAKNVTLNVGDNIVTVVVKAQDGMTTKTYTITVTRAKSSNADLSALTISEGTLTPGFTTGDVSYTASVGNAVTSIDVTSTVADATATVTVNDDPVTSGSVKSVTLDVGTNTIKVVVTAQDGTTAKTYTIMVTRAKSSNADLSALTLSDGTLNPVFSAGNGSYTASVGNEVTSIDVTPTVADSTATVTLNDDPVASGSSKNVTLNVGTNTVTVVVTAQNGTTKTYTITVTRAKSSNADLSALMLSAGTLTPVFNAGNEIYTASVGFDVTSVNVTPIAANTAAVIEVNEKPVVSGHAENVTLDVGANAIKINMTSEDGATTKTYNLIVTRLSNNTSLNELILTLGEQNIAVTGDNYSTSITNAVYSATVTASVYDANSSLQINGVTVASGSSSDIQLAEGPNTIVVKVTAQDLSVKEYAITVTRFGNAELSGLAVSGVALTPPFNLNTLTYTGSVSYDVSSVTVTASVYDPNAKLTINGIEGNTNQASLPISLAVGNNDIEILVTPTHGTPQKYTITISRAPSNMTSLLGLSINNGNVKVDKAADEKSYSATVSNSVLGITVKPQPTDPDAIVRVNGAALSPDGNSATIALNTGINEISISVTAPDGSVQAYKLFVTRLEAATPPVIVTPDPPAATVPDKVKIDGGDGTNNISIEVVRERTPDGRVIDKVTVTPELIKDLFEAVPGGVQNIIRLVIPKIPEGSSEFSFSFPTSAMEAMSEYGSILRIQMDDIQINIPKETIATNVQWGEGMYFRFIPMATEAVKQETVNRVMTSQVVTEAARGGIAVLHGTPMTIESNVMNKETKMTFSLKGAAIPADPLEREAFLASLGVYIEHSDGEKVLKKGQIEYDGQGNPVGIEIVVTKFSTFTVIEVQKKQVGTDTYKSWIDGYPDGTFKPQRLITRAEVASILARVLSDPGRNNGSQSFSDVSESHWAASAIQKAQAAGWISGYPDGSFKPDAPITRAELAVIFARLNKLEAAAGSVFFTDTQDHWAAGFIQAAKAAGLLAGYEDGSFRPDRQLTRAEAVKALNTLLKRPTPEFGKDVWMDVTKQEWFWADVQSASASFNMIRYEDGSSFTSMISE
ncbi:cadherin-like beta sandwich domain-containing protein, partial [Paenibacillus contaminans]